MTSDTDHRGKRRVSAFCALVKRVVFAQTVLGPQFLLVREEIDESFIGVPSDAKYLRESTVMVGQSKRLSTDSHRLIYTNLSVCLSLIDFQLN